MRRKEYRLRRLKEAREALEREKLEKVNVTDPESRLMPACAGRKDSRKVIQPSYNGQIAVDEKEQVIVAADVSQNATDHAEFRPLVEQVERNLGILPEEGSADAGYSSYDNLEFAEREGLDIPACRQTGICQITSWSPSMRRKRVRRGITRANSATTR